MSKRLINLLLALALAVSAFAGLTVAPAGAAQEVPADAIYFPWLPNGEEYGNMGPWYSAVTIQNIERFNIIVDIYGADGTLITTVSLPGSASTTWTAAQLLGNAGGGIFAQSRPINGPIKFDNVVRGAGIDTSDTINVGNCTVNTVQVQQGSTTFALGVDYNVAQAGNLLTIDWRPTGVGTNEPAPGTTYTVTVTCLNQVNPRIGGVVKEVTPVEPLFGAWTSNQHEAVSGYTSLPGGDVAPTVGPWVFPIVQTNNGWDTVLHITNYGGNNCSVTVDLYAADSGVTGPSDGHFSQLLNAGQTWHLGLRQVAWPAGWVGSAFVTANCPIAATANRLKASQPWGTPVNMAMTNVAQATQGGVQAVVYGPLVYQAYNGWNTGIAIANLDAANNNNVQITFFNKDGLVVHSESRTIQPRGMEVVYLPSTTDIGTNSLAQVIIQGALSVAAAIDAVKYTGADQDVGQATSYLAQRGTAAAAPPQTVNGTLSVALVQKQQGLTSQRDNSGIALFNGVNAQATVAGWFYDGAGARVAPTLVNPIVVTLPPFGGAILYTPWFGEMPNGFRGSFVAEVQQGVGPVSCVSNNVNYEVQFDGTATYNCFVTLPQ